MSEGVEWAVHSCPNLAWLGEERAVPAAKLAAFYELPPAYLNKQLQALARAGVVTPTSGSRGGFRLARPPEKITLMDVVAAIEGEEEAFRCTEIRHRGGSDSGERGGPPCAIHTSMRKAELAWRRELASQSIADIASTVEEHSPDASERVRRWFGDTRA
ncbi:Rrf2 family transcriptional regulator [Saccharopolyspora rhizosphaerae]|uniref:Rrf2 family transcriptional regulator n=1 Tax=Saccharopolyspora rhizosphaerae TaxID=2492662 RepID=A0A3R8P3R7_9PSEU|nr:Rrf2 family transcriptional regulator [Saccharopolyspora rhizosphaerae]RRO15732.1 Rrf2 family transcriptional regulator [Saccharopolyspora rhizosphaerae]